MSKKVKFFIVTGLAVLLLTFVIGIPAITANDKSTADIPPNAVLKQDGIIARVAAILNITSANLTQAIQQANKELKDTKPTADAYYTRVAAILGIDKATLIAAVTKAEKEIADARISKILEQAVAKGTITTDERAQIEAWLNQRPSAVDKLFNFNFLNGLKGWGHSHGFFGGQEKLEPKGKQNNNGHAKSNVSGTTSTTTSTATFQPTSNRLY